LARQDCRSSEEHGKAEGCQRAYLKLDFQEPVEL
jgi:hypothetical protein